MSRDFYRNRCALGSIPQADVLAPVYNIFEDFEDANLNFAFTVSGTGTWDRSTVAAHSGTYCYRGATNTSSTIYSEFTIPKTGTLSLYYRISSESISYDWGKIYVNGAQKVIVGGADTGWVLWSTPVVAGDVIKFEYRKDGSSNSGFDAFLIDDILLEVATGVGKTKLLGFNDSTDLTDNFTQTLGTGASQTVTSGVVQFRNGTYDQANYITTNFTINEISSLLLRHNWWRGGSASQESYNLDCNVLDQNNNVVTTFLLSGSYSHSYNDGTPHYYNAGYMFWKLGTDANNTTSKRLCSFPTAGSYHTHELVNLGGGYIQYKLDGVNQGSQIYLGNANYKLGGPIIFTPLGGWYNSNIYDDLDTFDLTYL